MPRTDPEDESPYLPGVLAVSLCGLAGSCSDETEDVVCAYRLCWSTEDAFRLSTPGWRFSWYMAGAELIGFAAEIPKPRARDGRGINLAAGSPLEDVLSIALRDVPLTFFEEVSNS